MKKYFPISPIIHKTENKIEITKKIDICKNRLRNSKSKILLKRINNICNIKKSSKFIPFFKGMFFLLFFIKFKSSKNKGLFSLIVFFKIFTGFTKMSYNFTSVGFCFFQNVEMEK